MELSAVHDGALPSICLFVEHGCPEMSHALYLINPPLDLSNYDQMVDSDGFMLDSKYISPVLTFPEKNHFLPFSASINLGSKIYFLGGKHSLVPASSRLKNRLAHQVQVFDTAHPEQGMQCVAPMNAPKESPCVFVADGIIYALGAAFPDYYTIPLGKPTGFFERYDPVSGIWKVLPDPPLPLVEWVGANLMDCATVVGRRVFITTNRYRVIFNLDTQDWDPLPSKELDTRFPYSPRFVPDTSSLYYLRGPNILKEGTTYIPFRYFDEPLRFVKRGPISTTKEGYDPNKEQVMPADFDLDENKYFTKLDICPWRELFHIGGRFFCYVVTVPLMDCHLCTHENLYFRGVWIKFFEEVPAHADYSNLYENTKFRCLASFCYKINTNFSSLSNFIRCSVVGTVPNSWINAPLKITQDRSLVMKTEQQEYKTKQSCHDLKHAVTTICWSHRHTQCITCAHNRETGDYDLNELLAAQEEDTNRLVGELAKVNDVLKLCEALLTEKGVSASDLSTVVRGQPSAHSILSSEW